MVLIEMNHNDNGAGDAVRRTEGEKTMKLWLRNWLLALCVAALMATSTWADGTYSLKVSEINGTPIALGKACCDGAIGAVCTPDVVGASCEFNSECTAPRQPACKPVVCDTGVPAHCPVGNSSCQLDLGGNFCTLPTVLNAGDVLPGDVIRVDAFIELWDELINTGFCLAADAQGTCTISPNSCIAKSVCSNTFSDCNPARICQFPSATCQGRPDITCASNADCANLDCSGGATCIPNKCVTSPLLTGYQWGFDLPGMSSGTTGTIDFATLPCTVDTDCRHGETISALCTCTSALCMQDQTCSNPATTFIQESRPDYIFADQIGGGFPTVARNSFILEYTHAGDSNVIPVLDEREEKNIGTILLSPSSDANGTFTLGFTPSVGVNFFLDESSASIPVTNRNPLVINMASPPGCNDIPVPQTWTSIGQHGPGCIFNPACGGAEYGQDIPASGALSESRSTGINKIVVVYDIPVDVSNAIVTVDGCDVDGFVQNTAGITMTVVPGASPNEAVLLFTPSLPGNNAAIGETPVVYDITISEVACDDMGNPGIGVALDETRTVWAIFGDANPAPITVNNGDLGFVRSARDIILARPAGMQVIDPFGATGVFEIRADINNDNTVSNGDLGLVRTARDMVQQPTGLCP